MNYLVQLVLMPFSVLYGLINAIRNILFDKKVLKSVRFAHPIISVGNLSVGGTGKTPHIEYLIQLLKPLFQIATLSRGYGRKSAGLIYADQNSSAKDIGDEPMQYFMKNQEVPVVVCENRLLAIPDILGAMPYNQCILLDDAMQHRTVNPGLSIMISQYEKPFYKDYIIPAGRLREPRSGYKRADIIVVSKCPATITDIEKNEIIQQIKPYKYQHVYFSTLKYGSIYPMFNHLAPIHQFKEYDIFILTGIADNQKVIQHCKSIGKEVFSFDYKDHHYFDRYDIEKVSDLFSEISNPNKIILTTEKDATRLALEKEFIWQKNLPIYILPVQVEFIGNDKNRFDADIIQYINSTLQKHHL
jgi:tetraacyldisaccharide 4'-kinase